jgi:thioredoxin reductase (NADPH)
MERVTDHRVIVVGSGPAGCTAAIYLSRANLAPLVLEGLQPGGQLTITTDVENYPGFPEGVLGPKLMDLMRQQAERFGAVFKMEQVESVNLRTHPFTITTDQREYECDALIIAAGASAMQIGLPSEKELQGFGVSYCATCDGFFFKNKEIVVVGGGDSAMEEATFLTKFASKVTIVHRRDELRASKIMQDRARKNPKIEFVWNVVVDDILGDEKNGGITALVLKDTTTNATREMPTEGLFIAIGHEPNTKLFAGQLEMDDRGYLITDAKTSYTSVPGVFACGDAQDPTYRQAVTAAGSGCMAAIDAERFLEAQEHAH